MITEKYLEDLNSPCQELSNGGLGFCVDLLVCHVINFCLFLLGVYSSCTTNPRLRAKSSCQGASTGVEQNFIFSFFGGLFLKIDELP